MKHALVAFTLFFLSLPVWAESLFRDGRPPSYTAEEGDTLWGIAGYFLNDPWRWREVWDVDPSISDPDLIFPGDVIRVIKVGGELKLTLSRKQEKSIVPDRTVKLRPQIRSTPLIDAIPAIPLDAIHSFLGMSRVLDGPGEAERAPRVISSGQERVISGAGDTVYARGGFTQRERVFGVFRKGKTYKDPVTREDLGILMQHVGSVNMKGLLYDVGTFQVAKATEEVRIGDKLLVSEERRLATSFFPGSPDNPYVEGQILDVIGGVHSIGLYSNVVLNLGTRERMQDGDVLAIYRSNTVKDKKTGEVLGLPLQRVGLVMIYRTYQKVSFAVVMQATRPLENGDVLRAP